jgi:transposase InsO family protein
MCSYDDWPAVSVPVDAAPTPHSHPGLHITASWAEYVLCAAAHNTYIPTWEGWVYLATVIDCATRKVAGWAMDDNYRTPLITSAIGMAARNLGLPADAVFHSDRGSNYTSAEFAAALERLGIRQSVGRTGICLLTG